MTIPWAKYTAFLVLPAAAFAAGRLSRKPPPAEVRSAEAVQKQDQAQAQATQAAAAGVEQRQASTAQHAKRRRRTVRESTAPDGTKTREVATDTESYDLVVEELQRREWQAFAARLEAARASFLAAQRQAVTITQPARSWAASVMGGVNAGAIRGDDRRWWVGGALTHAFLGPLRWGAAVVVEQGVHVNLGLVVGVDF